MPEFDFHPALFAVAPAAARAKPRTAPHVRRASPEADAPARVSLKALAVLCDMDRPDALVALERCGLIDHGGRPTPWAVAEGLGAMGSDRKGRALALWDERRVPAVLALSKDFHALSRFENHHRLVARGHGLAGGGWPGRGGGGRHWHRRRGLPWG